jgi:hypothetical protein
MGQALVSRELTSAEAHPMAPTHEHFPTFARVGSLIARPSGAIGTGKRILSERFMLRAVLWLILLAASASFAASRYLMIKGQMGPYGRGYPPAVYQDGSWASFLIAVTLMICPAEQALLIVVLCLVGLAASCDRGVATLIDDSEPKPRPKTVATPPSPSPGPVERHPLDPSPDDPPLRHPWPKH